MWRHYSLTVVEVSYQCASHCWYTLDIGIAYIQHAVGKCTDGIFTGEERKESTLLLTKSQRRNHCLRSFQNPSRQSKVTTGKKGPTNKQTNKQTKTNPPRIQSVHQLNVPSGWWRRNEQGVPAGVQRLLPSHSLQTITLLSIDQTKTSAYCVHSYVNDEETNPLSPDMKKFREHQKRRKESRAEKDGDKKKKKKEPKQTEVFMWRHLTCRLFSRHHVLPSPKSLQEETRYIQLMSFPWLINKVCAIFGVSHWARKGHAR